MPSEVQEGCRYDTLQGLFWQEWGRLRAASPGGCLRLFTRSLPGPHRSGEFHRGLPRKIEDRDRSIIHRRANGPHSRAANLSDGFIVAMTGHQKSFTYRIKGGRTQVTARLFIRPKTQATSARNRFSTPSVRYAYSRGTAVAVRSVVAFGRKRAPRATRLARWFQTQSPKAGACPGYEMKIPWIGGHLPPAAPPPPPTPRRKSLTASMPEITQGRLEASRDGDAKNAGPAPGGSDPWRQSRPMNLTPRNQWGGTTRSMQRPDRGLHRRQK